MNNTDGYIIEYLIRYEINNDNSSAFRVSVNNAYSDYNSITTSNAIQSVIQTKYTAYIIY